MQVLVRLDRNDRDGFHTPFANFQRWQGFADVFLKTTAGVGTQFDNKNGLNDLKIQALIWSSNFWKVKSCLSYV